MLRKHQTRSLEIPDRRFASSGMTVERLEAGLCERQKKKARIKRALERVAFS
jgi:hypothetical protein